MYISRWSSTTTWCVNAALEDRVELCWLSARVTRLTSLYNVDTSNFLMHDVN